MSSGSVVSPLLPARGDVSSPLFHGHSSPVDPAEQTDGAHAETFASIDQRIIAVQQQLIVQEQRSRDAHSHAEVSSPVRISEFSLDAHENQELSNLSRDVFDKIRNKRIPSLGSIYPMNLRTTTLCVFAVLSNSQNIFFVPGEIRDEVFFRLTLYAKRNFENGEEWIRSLKRDGRR